MTLFQAENKWKRKTKEVQKNKCHQIGERIKQSRGETKFFFRSSAGGRRKMKLLK